MISSRKKTLLHVAAQKLGISEQEYRYVLIEHTGKMSSADPQFTDEDFKKVLDHFKAVGFWVARKAQSAERRAPAAGDLPTPQQLRVIEHLWKDLAEYVAGAHYVAFRRGFYEKRLNIPALGPQTRAQANRAIEALKKRVHSEMRRKIHRRGAEGAEVGIGAKEEA